MDLNIPEHPHETGCVWIDSSFFGNTEAVEEIFENIRQNLTNSKHIYKDVADRVVNQVIAWDKDGLTSKQLTCLESSSKNFAALA